jgi:hypothetical protein
VTTPGDAALVNDGEKPSDFVSKPVFGDLKLHAEVMLPEGGGGGVMLLGRYEIRFTADRGFGAIPPGPGQAGRAPSLESFRGPGQWHDLDLVFRAPRFDESGKKVEDARFEKVLVDDILLHESIDLSGPTEGGIAGEVARGPLRFSGDRGVVALRGIAVRPMDGPVEEAGFVPLFDGEGLEGWETFGEATWLVDDDEVLVGSGRKGFLATTRDDYRDFELVARMKVSGGGNSGLFLRASASEGGLAGYEAEVNSSYPDEQHTGSLRDLAPVKAHLVAPGTWFDYRVRCVDEAGGTRLTIAVGGIVVTDFVDPEHRHARGRIAIEQHHEGSTVEIRALAIRVL